MTPVIDNSRRSDREFRLVAARPPRAPRSRAVRRVRRVAWALLLLLVVAAIGPRITTFVIARGDIAHAPGDLPRLAGDDRRAAIVLGASVAGEEPSPLLRARIDGAVALLDADRVDVLLMSGDNTTQYYDEPTVMRNYALADGRVSDELVAVDYAGRRTWDSCVRARRVFGIREAVVVTNAFHVDRAVVTCRAAGIDVTGYSVSEGGHAVVDRLQWRGRELAATGRALVDAWVVKPAPAVDEGDRIDPWQPCEIYDSLAPSVREESAADFAAFDC